MDTSEESSALRLSDALLLKSIEVELVECAFLKCFWNKVGQRAIRTTLKMHILPIQLQ